MGIFSTKRKHYVDTSVVRMVEDESVPNSRLTALVESIFSEETTIVSAIKYESLYGNQRNFEKMYEYAKNGNYFYGLPNATVASSDDARIYVVPAIEADTGHFGVVLDYYFFRPLNNIHAGWKHLHENLSYVKSTNIIGTITATVGFDCYLNKMVAVHETLPGQEIEQDAIGTWEASAESGETPERPLWDDHNATAGLVTTHEYRVGTAETESVEIHYSYIDDVTDPATVLYDFVVLNLSSYDTDQEYHQAKYHYTLVTVVDGAAVQTTYTGYWTYDHLTGGHATLNGVYADSYVNPGTYFPIAVFRSEDGNRATTALQTTQEYITTEKLLKFIGMDFREIGDSMHADPDIGDIDQAVMLMAVPINSTNKAELQYLFKYFSALHDLLPTDAIDGNYDQAPNRTSSDFGLSGGPNKSWAVDIQDADFRMTLSFQGIKKRYRAGSIGAVGTYENYVEALDPYNLPFRDLLTGQPSYQTGTASRDQRTFRYQVTADIYEEVTVDSPQARYHIYKDKGAEAGANDGRCLIPLDYNITKNMSFLVKEELYFRSLHFVFNSHVVQTIKWWQRGAFKIVLLIVAVVLAAYGSDLGFKLWVAAQISWAAVVWVLIKFIVLFFAIGEITKIVFAKVAEALGPEVALWLAVIAFVVAGKQVLNSGRLLIEGTASKFLYVANGLARGASQAFGTMIEDLIDDYAEFQILAEALEEELQRGKDLLGVNLDISPFTFIGAEPLMIPGEKPEDYYERLSHAGNVGAKSLNIVQNFVSVSLTLPTIEQTIEESAWL